MVSCRVWIVSSPERAKELEEVGMLLYCVFGDGTSVWPDPTALEPHGEGSGSYVQDLAWLLVGWLYGRDPKALPSWYDLEADAIKYRDRSTGQIFACTHQPNYQTFYSAWHRIGQDSVTGELGGKVSATQEYAAERRSISQAVVSGT